MKINPKKCIKKMRIFDKRCAYFSCRSANLPENTSKISRGIQWKISRHSLENIENIKAFNGKYKGNRMESDNKGGAAAPPLL